MNVKVGGKTMNNWGKFAEMLGLKLEQEFVLTDVDGKIKNELTYKITEHGLLCKSLKVNDWLTVSLITFRKIMNGDYKVVTKPWKPKKGGTYWFFSYSLKQKMSSKWGDGTYDLILWKSGNCFRTKEEAETKGKEIMEQIQKDYEEY